MKKNERKLFYFYVDLFFNLPFFFSYRTTRLSIDIFFYQIIVQPWETPQNLDEFTAADPEKRVAVKGAEPVPPSR